MSSTALSTTDTGNLILITKWNSSLTNKWKKKIKWRRIQWLPVIRNMKITPKITHVNLVELMSKLKWYRLFVSLFTIQYIQQYSRDHRNAFFLSCCFVEHGLFTCIQFHCFFCDIFIYSKHSIYIEECFPCASEKEHMRNSIGHICIFELAP